MYRLFRQALYVIYLVLFSAYAVSPVYLSNTCALRTTAGNYGHSCGNVRVGIFSVKVVLSALVSDQEKTASNTCASFSRASQDDELLLIQKKRGVIRAYSDIKPTLQTATLPSGISGLTATFSREYDMPGASYGLGSDGYIHHATGRPPPFLLS